VAPVEELLVLLEAASLPRAVSCDMPRFITPRQVSGYSLYVFTEVHRACSTQRGQPSRGEDTLAGGAQSSRARSRVRAGNGLGLYCGATQCSIGGQEDRTVL